MKWKIENKKMQAEGYLDLSINNLRDLKGIENCVYIGSCLYLNDLPYLESVDGIQNIKFNNKISREWINITSNWTHIIDLIQNLLGKDNITADFNNGHIKIKKYIKKD